VLSKIPLIVIVGPTASGKSALALMLAERHNGEIIAADSRTVYKGMDIGTAKPSRAEQAHIKHHLLDVTTPDKVFTAAEFQRQANAAIADIESRGKLPILVGGSGLYIDGVIFDFKFQPPVDAGERARLSKMSVEELQAEIVQKGYPMPENKLNPRYLMRTIERKGVTEERGDLRANTLIIGLAPDIKVLKGRIVKRVGDMVEDGLVEETKDLVKRYGKDAPGLLSTSYKAIIQHIEGELSLEQAKEQFVLNDLHFAKRQKSWFKRNKHINWVANQAAAHEIVMTFLQQNKEANPL
jgi:tRNA dimethylallyltransferase